MSSNKKSAKKTNDFQQDLQKKFLAVVKEQRRVVTTLNKEFADRKDGINNFTIRFSNPAEPKDKFAAVNCPPADYAKDGYPSKAQIKTLVAMTKSHIEVSKDILFVGVPQSGKTGVIVSAFFILPIIHYLKTGIPCVPFVTIPSSRNLNKQMLNPLIAFYRANQHFEIEVNGKSISILEYFSGILGIEYKEYVKMRNKAEVDNIRKQAEQNFREGKYIMIFNDECHIGQDKEGVHEEIDQEMRKMEKEMNLHKFGMLAKRIDVSATPAEQLAVPEVWNTIYLTLDENYVGPNFNYKVQMPSVKAYEPQLPLLVTWEEFFGQPPLDPKTFQKLSLEDRQSESRRIADCLSVAITDDEPGFFLRTNFEQNYNIEFCDVMRAVLSQDITVIEFFGKLEHDETLVELVERKKKETGNHKYLIVCKDRARYGVTLPDCCINAADFTWDASDVASLAQGTYARMFNVKGIIRRGIFTQQFKNSIEQWLKNGCAPCDYQGNPIISATRAGKETRKKPSSRTSLIASADSEKKTFRLSADHPNPVIRDKFAAITPKVKKCGPNRSAELIAATRAIFDNDFLKMLPEFLGERVEFLCWDETDSWDETRRLNGIDLRYSQNLESSKGETEARIHHQEGGILMQLIYAPGNTRCPACHELYKPAGQRREQSAKVCCRSNMDPVVVAVSLRLVKTAAKYHDKNMKLDKCSRHNRLWAFPPSKN